MDALMFLKEFNRMCDTYWVENCRECPLNGKACSLRHGDYEKIIATVEKWSAEHPVKTRLMDFLEKYPNARLMEGTRMPFLTPDILGYCGMNRCKSCEHERYTRAHCWNLPLEE